jgi:hypothetical protein
MSGDLKIIHGTFTPTNANYNAGGEAFDLAADWPYAIKTVHMVAFSAQGGYVHAYDATNKKVLAYRQSAATSALTEPTGVNISAAQGAIPWVAFVS